MRVSPPRRRPPAPPRSARVTDWDDADAAAAPERNNERLLDANAANQGLSREEINAMVAAGTAGAAIVGALAASSATFAAKTEFSQEKYLKRKGRKYIFGAVARRPTAATLVAACWSKHPARVGYLRHDALALMLNLADAGAGARLLVLDTCGGLVTAAAAERLGGDGDLCAAFVGAAAPAAMDAGRVLNLGAKAKAAIRTVPLLALLRERRALLAA
jgi:tRNA (adenine-N(1)-)-methyltransferase non-catalytic subunit